MLSTDELKENVDNPKVVLSSFIRKRDKVGAENHNHFYTRGHASPDGACSSEDGRKNLLRRLSRTQPSLNFLDTGYHFVLHDFPWKREELLREVEATDGEDAVFNTGTGPQVFSTAQASSLFSPISKHSRMASDGSEDVFEPENIISDIAINLDEDQNEEQRRIQANLKWNVRRQKIEQEINRLRHFSINKSRAVAGGGPRLRHSVSFGDDLEIQLESSGMRALVEEDEDEEDSEEDSLQMTRLSRNRNSNHSYKKSLTLGARAAKPFQRAVSMPGEDMEGILKKECFPVMKPSELQAYSEEEEDELEEEDKGEEGMERVGRLALPPKDVPVTASLGERLALPPKDVPRTASLGEIHEWEGTDEVD